MARFLWVCVLCALVACSIACGTSSQTTTAPGGTSGASGEAAPKPKEEEETTVYAAVKDMYCATDPKFLDASALTSPANFAMVKSGTQVVRMGVGGLGSGKRYYSLSAGGRQQIYVYRDIFEQNFRALEDEKAGEPELTAEEKAELEKQAEEKRQLQAEFAAEQARLDKIERTRVWKSPSGTFSLEAEFVRYANGKAVLRKADGSETEVDAAKLSDEDRAWIDARRNKK